MNSIPFYKLQSIGNDFVLIRLGDFLDASSLTLDSSQIDKALMNLALRTCHRRFGIGADGLLIFWKGGSTLHLRMFNPDGTEDFCGNGLRCAVHHAIKSGWIEQESIVEHFGHRIRVEAMNETNNEEIRTLLGQAVFEPNLVPLFPGTPSLFLSPMKLAGQEYELSSVNTGSTHTVLLVGQLPLDPEFLLVSQELEHHPMFPERTSVIWTKIVTEDELQIRIWERGVGETLGCGTGSAAAAIVYARSRGMAGPILVQNPGGTLSVHFDRWDSPIWLQGSAKEVFKGVLEGTRVKVYAK